MLATFALILAGRFIIRPIVVPIAIRTGMRTIVVAGAYPHVAAYPILAEVNGFGPILFSLIAMTALADAFYWPGFHAYYAALGTHENRGSEISAREALAALVGIVTPAVAGWILVAYGPQVAFGVTTPCFFCSGRCPCFSRRTSWSRVMLRARIARHYRE